MGVLVVVFCLLWSAPRVSLCPTLWRSRLTSVLCRVSVVILADEQGTGGAPDALVQSELLLRLLMCWIILQLHDCGKEQTERRCKSVNKRLL